MALSTFSRVQVLEGKQVLRAKDEEFGESWGAQERRGEGVGEWDAAADAATLEPEATRNTCALVMCTKMDVPLIFGINREKFIKALQFGKTSLYKPALPICTCSYTTVNAHKRSRAAEVGLEVGWGGPGPPAALRGNVGSLEATVYLVQGRGVDAVCCSLWGFDINFYFNF